MTTPTTPPTTAPAEHRWRRHAVGLAEYLARAGYLDTRWQAVFAAVPRHLLITAPDRTDHDLPTIYSADDGHGADPAPAVLARVLELLDGDRPRTGADEPIRVLQAGAGGAYLTALLCRGLGDRHVVVAETDPARAGATSAALERLGWYPEILVAEAGRITARHGPYAGILAGHRPDQDPALAPACLRQLARGGRLLWWPTDPGDEPMTVEVLDRGPDDLVFGRRVIDPHHQAPGRLAARALSPDDELAVAHLTADPGLCAEIRSQHTADDTGSCRACSEAHDAARRWPCLVRTLADLAHSRTHRTLR